MDGTQLRTESQRRDEVYRLAYSLFSRSPKPDWVTFYKETLGLNGIIRQMYPAAEALAEFEQSETYAEILRMLTRLRERPASDTDVQEPTRVITVRLPCSVHEALREEAHEHRTSMNQLCISKLLQFIENELIPKERWRSRSASKRERTEKKGPGADL